MNTLEYAVLFQTRLDEQFVRESATAWMEGNAGLVIYEGGNTVKVPKRTVNGLGNYSRTSGYPSGGAVTLSWETFTFTQDRAQAFNLDKMDVNETNFLIAAGDVLKQFQTEQVIPEVDSYRFSTIFALANQKLRTGSYTPSASDIYSTLSDQIKDIQDVIGQNVSLVVMMSGEASKVLSKSTEITKYTIVGDQNFANGNINTKVKMLDGLVPIIEVPSARMKSAFAFDATAGFAASSVAMKINWIIMAKNAPLAIVKNQAPKIIAPETNQSYDGWSIFYRLYHDLWIFDNKFAGIYVSYTAIAAPALSVTVTKPTTLGKTKWAATAETGHTLAYKMSASAGTDKYNDIPTGITAYISGTEISATAGQHMLCYELDATGHIVKYLDYTLTSSDIGTGS